MLDYLHVAITPTETIEEFFISAIKTLANSVGWVVNDDGYSMSPKLNANSRFRLWQTNGSLRYQYSTRADETAAWVNSIPNSAPAAWEAGKQLYWCIILSTTGKTFAAGIKDSAITTPIHFIAASGSSGEVSFYNPFYMNIYNSHGYGITGGSVGGIINNSVWTNAKEISLARVPDVYNGGVFDEWFSLLTTPLASIGTGLLVLIGGAYYRTISNSAIRVT